MNVLAHILPPPKPELRSLFYGKDTTARGESRDGAITLEEGSLLSFEGYFNVFFEAPLTSLTDLKEISLQLVLEGSVEVAIYRTSSSGARQLIHATEQYFDTHTPFTYTGSLNSQDASYLAFSIRSKGPETRFFSGAWTTSQVGRSDVYVAGVTRTYLREEQLQALVLSLTEDPVMFEQPFELLVVDNSNSMLPAALSEFGSRVIPQQNSGSSGGFTRGILDALDGHTRHPVTHILLMDDDIEIQPETLFRTIQLLRYQCKPCILGAPLFDCREPTVVDISGETFDTGKSALSPRPLFDRFIPAASLLPRASALGKTEWTGWWFAVFPVEAFNQGLPLPVFVRGDDIEFGLRLKRQGMASRYIAGWAIWHEPFGSAMVRLPDWIHYYNMRNGLIHRALHADNVNVSQLAWQIFTQQFNHYVYTFQYGAAEVLLKGVEDFLRGPQAVFDSCPRSNHAAVKEAASRFAAAQTQRPAEEPGATPHVPLWQKVLGVLTFHGHLLPRSWSRRPPLFIKRRELRRRHTLGRESVHVTDESTGCTFAYRRDRRAFLTAWRRRNSLRATFLHSFPTVASQWRREAGRYADAHFWRDYLSMSHPRENTE
jgi:galactofuranosylgalactofuranosylrhamnosyl-N-acetylglucosaminyl-diphospho-decaprenol beta-1,5/1,6-galactofuranosyltransferase